MLLSRRTYAKILPEYSNIIVHMCYATSKLWNVCNYERRHYKELGREKYPDWYYQKKEHKGDLWYRHSAQKGYGFITGEDGIDYFAHFSEIQMDGYRKLSGGQPVLFEAGTDANGRSLAKNISPADPNAE